MGKHLRQITLGILTSIGGFLDVGSLATAVQAGTEFRYGLVWALVVGTVCAVVLVQMSGRLAAVSRHTVIDAMRERFGFKLFLVPFLAELIVDFALLGAEIGGVCIALNLMTGIGVRWLALPVAFGLWTLLWRGTFGVVERSTSYLGLLTLCFVVAAVLLHPHWGQVAAGIVPRPPAHAAAHYWFVGVSIFGATLTPYMFYFYSSGAIEEGWTEASLASNNVTSVVGMSFGGVVALGVLVTAALTLAPAGVPVESYEQIAGMLVPVFGRTGFWLFSLSLGIACFGAALEVALDAGYVTAQAFGWKWSQNQAPRDDARFSLVYTVALFASALLLVFGVNPLKLTVFTMALIAVVLPFVVLPFLVLMNDRHYVGRHRNGWIRNLAVAAITVVAFCVAAATIPLELMGG